MSEEQRGGFDVEQLLGDALRPIEPPERLSGRFEDTMSALSQAAAEELSDWAEELSESELRALRDPRNWLRPAAAAAVGGVAGGALVLIELRRRKRPGGVSAVTEQLRARMN
jgi:H+/Cl- antiporter ClcA